MRCVCNRIVLRVKLSACNLLTFGLDCLHGFYEAVHLLLRLTFGRLYHEGFMNRERECRSVESKVHESLGNVRRPYSVFLHEVPAVQQALVCNPSCSSGVNGRILILERLGDVVGIEDGNLAGLLKAFRTQQLDVCMGDREQQRIAVEGS